MYNFLFFFFFKVQQLYLMLNAQFTTWTPPLPQPNDHRRRAVLPQGHRSSHQALNLTPAGACRWVRGGTGGGWGGGGGWLSLCIPSSWCIESFKGDIVAVRVPALSLLMSPHPLSRIPAVHPGLTKPRGIVGGGGVKGGGQQGRGPGEKEAAGLCSRGGMRKCCRSVSNLSEGGQPH